jgi:uncharacterized membrane protein
MEARTYSHGRESKRVNHISTGSQKGADMTIKGMTGLHRSTVIDAPIEKVFAYYADPVNLPEVWPSLIEVKDVTHAPEGWPQRFRWVYKMAGMRLEGITETTAFEPNRRFVTESKGGIESIIETLFEDLGSRTRVTDQVQYRVPIPLLGRIAERVLARMNENEFEVIHANLKVRMEGEAS